MVQSPNLSKYGPKPFLEVVGIPLANAVIAAKTRATSFMRRKGSVGTWRRDTEDKGSTHKSPLFQAAPYTCRQVHPMQVMSNIGLLWRCNAVWEWMKPAML